METAVRRLVTPEVLERVLAEVLRLALEAESEATRLRASEVLLRLFEVLKVDERLVLEEATAR